ncbi:MAG: aldo/keto reductase [Nitriliruptorales bacterium]|nr:aldo/keto reductase [Nitriliruptorales bacterium]
MQYRTLGRSGLRVSELALGTMTFGTDWGWGADADTCAAMFERYVEAGGNLIDTACNYTDGSAERIVGDLIEGDRDRYVVATKYTLTTDRTDINAGGNSRKNMVRTVRDSLERMRTDYIDLLYLHMWDDTTPLVEVLRGMDDLVASGQVHYVAFSDTPAWVVSQALTLAEQYGWPVPIAVQVPYSAFSRSIERDVIPMADSLGLAVFVWGVLGGGALTGKHLEGDTEDARVKGLKDETAAQVQEFVSIADRLGTTPVALAVAWARSHPMAGGPIPILGARSVEQLDGQLEALDVELGEDTWEEIAAIRDFKLEFPRDFLGSDNVLDLVHGDFVGRLEY